MVLEDVHGIILFVLQYTETNGILWPGIQRDDLLLLESSTTKRAVWMLSEESATANRSRPVAYSISCRVWKSFLSHVVVCKPMTEVYATCQQHSTAIVYSSNFSYEEKLRFVATLHYDLFLIMHPVHKSTGLEGNRSTPVMCNV